MHTFVDPLVLERLYCHHMGAIIQQLLPFSDDSLNLFLCIYVLFAVGVT